MSTDLSTVTERESLNRVVIEPVSRVEGHGKVTLLADDDNVIREARLHIVEFRGFERFIQGRPYWDVPVVVQRLCGICPVSHHLAAGKAIDQIVGAKRLTPTAKKLRELVHFGQILQSHALHFFHLSSPDLLFGFESDVAKRNIIGVIEAFPDIALQGVKLRKYGQEIIRAICGKRIHGTGAVPGGMNKSLSESERNALQSEIDQIIEWSQAAVNLSREYYLSNQPMTRDFGTMPSNFLGLVKADGALELYDGKLRAKDAAGKMIFDQVSDQDYHEYIREEVRNWSYMKFPYLTELGKDSGWYRVGPLARVNNCDYIDSPLAEEERLSFKEHGEGGMLHAPLAYHWARMIELLHCAEKIRDLLDDPEILGTDLINRDQKRNSFGIGVIEATRGTLFHHYEVDDNDLVRKANLIVSTTNNNQAMNESIRRVAADHLSGRELTEPLLNNIEVAIRAYDPCLSCATHAVGKMPLLVELRDSRGELVDRLQKHSDGKFD
ncbi:MAG: Ni/Fe hydrogenase subunit alpha [Woeseiaceae bacterium]|nr:Ni/Fe hydrogenase subunit alpha [Woeseiaceae bacterium]